MTKNNISVINILLKNLVKINKIGVRMTKDMSRDKDNQTYLISTNISRVKIITVLL